ncbi:MAG: DUF4214 domain-containing protein [Acidimicrobiales bacterium]
MTRASDRSRWERVGWPFAPFDVVAPNSLVRRTDYGVLTLDLLEDSWGLEFVGVGDAGVLDRASDTCVNAPVLQVTESQAPLYRLYKAVFLRRPDQAGLDYWTGISNEGVSLMSIAGLFADSAEFTNRYSAVGDDEFLTLLYRNTLGRTPDPPATPTGSSRWRAVSTVAAS